MEKIKIDLKEEFKDNLCSFEVAKKAKAAGMNSANTYFAYDEEGGFIDAGWMEAEHNLKFIRENTGKPDWMPPVMYPAINIPFAIEMLGEIGFNPKEMECCELYDEKEGVEFLFVYKGEETRNRKLVDLFVEVWIKYKKDK